MMKQKYDAPSGQCMSDQGERQPSLLRLGKHIQKIFSNPFRGFVQYLISFSLTQLLLTVGAMPILIGWGLGTSVMSLIGNLVFTPVLIVFILLSSLLLFTELCGIPNVYIAHTLDQITIIWERVLNYGSSSWMIECAKPPTTVLIGILVFTFIALHHPWVNSVKRRFIVLGSILMLLYGICWTYQRTFQSHGCVRKFDEKLYVIPLADRSVIVVDNGFFSRKKSIEKALEFEFKPWMVKQFGGVNIKEFRVTKANVGSLMAAHHACTLWKIKEVWVPFFKKLQTPKAWWSFFTLKEFAKKHDILFIRYDSK